MKHSLLIKTALITVAVPLFAGCAERVVYRDRPVYVAQPPPPVYVSPPPAPGARPATVPVPVPSTPPPSAQVVAPPTQAVPQAQVVYNDPTVLPPVPVEVIPVQPDPTYVWIGGGYRWYGGRWV